MKVNDLAKKIFLFATVVFLSLSVLPRGNAAELVFADSFPTKHFLSTEGMIWWMDRVTELTNGSVTFKHFPAEQLAKASGILKKVQDGAADAGYIGIGYVSERMPLNGVAMLPGLTSDPVSASYAYWDLVKKGGLGNEFEKNDVVPLFAILLPAYQVGLNKGKIAGIEDFKGLKLRSSGSLNLVAQGLGAVPVAMPAPDTYLAMQRGTLDGVLFPSTSIKPYNLQEVIASITTNAAMGSFGIDAAMNAKTYAKLTEAEKKAVRQAGDETVEHLVKYIKQLELSIFEEFQKGGMETYSLPEEVLKKLEPIFIEVQQDWVKRMEGRGLDSAGALKEFKAALSSK